MSDLLAKCDWHGDELHVYIAEWPEVVYVWVDEKTMPYAPVVADVRSLQAEIKALKELVRDMWREGAFESGANYVTEAYELEERTRELGIEVGG